MKFAGPRNWEKSNLNKSVKVQKQHVPQYLKQSPQKGNGVVIVAIPLTVAKHARLKEKHARSLVGVITLLKHVDRRCGDKAEALKTCCARYKQKTISFYKP